MNHLNALVRVALLTILIGGVATVGASPEAETEDAPEGLLHYRNDGHHPVIFSGETIHLRFDVQDIEFFTPLFGSNRALVNHYTTTCRWTSFDTFRTAWRVLSGVQPAALSEGPGSLPPRTHFKGCFEDFRFSRCEPSADEWRPPSVDKPGEVTLRSPLVPQKGARLAAVWRH